MATLATRASITGLFLLIITAAAWAQSPTAPLSLSLDDAIGRAVAAAPRIAAARARTRAANETAESRAALASPVATAISGFTRTNHIDPLGIPGVNGTINVLFPDIPDNYMAAAQIAVPIYTAGRVDALVQSSRADARAADTDRQIAEHDIRLEVTRAYWTLVTAREMTKVLEQGLARTDAYVGDVRARVENGVLPPNDLLSAQALRARESVQIIQAKNNAAVAEADLARLIDADVNQPIVTTTPVDREAPGAADLAAQSFETLLGQARRQREERAGFEDRRASLVAAGAAALATTRPQVAATAQVQPARPNQIFVPRTDAWRTSWSVGVNATWSFFDGGRAAHDHASALAQAEAIAHGLDDFDALLSVEVRQRLLDVESGRAALEAAADAVAAATEARRVVGERFRAGVATSTDVLDAEVAELQSELERTELQAALRVSEARLLRAVGGV